MDFLKVKTAAFLDSTAVTVIMTLITVYALYFDDIRILFFPMSTDNVFFDITFVGMLCFSTEIILASIVQDNYMFSFFFYLDIVSTISMIPDVGWLWELIIGDGGTGSKSTTDLAKTSRASKVTRVIRIIRLIRLIRIVKLYKQKQKVMKKNNNVKGNQIKHSKHPCSHGHGNAPSAGGLSKSLKALPNKVDQQPTQNLLGPEALEVPRVHNSVEQEEAKSGDDHCSHSHSVSEE